MEGLPRQESKRKSGIEELKDLINRSGEVPYFGFFRGCANAFSKLDNVQFAEKSARALLKVCVLENQKDITENNVINFGHTLGHAYNSLSDVKYHFGEISTESSQVLKKLGEFLGKVCEAIGDFPKAYMYYKESEYEKYKDKILNVEKSNFIDFENNRDWWMESNNNNFPGFQNLQNQPEQENYQKELFNDFLQTIPEDILIINPEEEKNELINEANKIIAES